MKLKKREVGTKKENQAVLHFATLQMKQAYKRYIRLRCLVLMALMKQIETKKKKKLQQVGTKKRKPTHLNGFFSASGG